MKGVWKCGSTVARTNSQLASESIKSILQRLERLTFVSVISKCMSFFFFLMHYKRLFNGTFADFLTSFVPLHCWHYKAMNNGQLPSILPAPRALLPAKILQMMQNMILGLLDWLLILDTQIQGHEHDCRISLRPLWLFTWRSHQTPVRGSADKPISHLKSPQQTHFSVAFTCNKERLWTLTATI